jgi:RNA polymerase sigma factor (TIGR02999 family)
MAAAHSLGGTVVNEVTQILAKIESGDPTAAEQLLPLVYDELRRLAAQRLAQEKPGQTLQATALVHEAYLRLVDGNSQKWNGRGHFFGAAAEAMRRIMVESARRKQSLKAGGGHQKFSLDEADGLVFADTEKLLAVDDVLDKLAAESPEAAELVKLRVFAGMTVNEAADVLGVSRTTAFRHWTYARAWIRAAFADEG